MRKQLDEAKQSERLPHALLFNAEKDCGHDEFVFDFAKSLLCLQAQNHGVACNECRSCEVFQAASHPDFIQIKVPDDKQIISVDQIRTLNQFLELSRSYSPVRIAIICDAEAMNINAANSLLKTLEEPVANTHILLYSHQANSLLPTIRSRCQQIRMPLPIKAEAISWLSSMLPTGESPESLLALSAGRPLSALQLIDGDLAEKRHLWMKQLLDLLTGQVAFATISTDWSKQDKRQLIDWQITLVQNMLRERVTGIIPAQEADQELNNQLAQLMASRDLWQLSDGLMQLKALAAHPLNAQLFAENMLSLWKNK
ncbi:MAG: DNA polymerase III subunit delta' [Thiolinea sp.]